MDPAAKPAPTVWVVEDNPLDAQLVRQALAAEHRLEVFREGTSMLERLAAGPAPDVLVLDVVLPDVNGLDVLRYLRSTESAGEVRPGVVLVTARREPRMVEEALASGADDYLVKPYAAVELRARVAAVLRQKRLLERALGAEASLRSLLEHTPDALAAIDRVGRVLLANQELERLLGARPGELVGELLASLLPRLELGDPARRLTAGERVSLPDLELGGRIYAPTARRWPRGGTSPALLVSLRDVTEERRATARRLDFYSIIAHDLRTPLWAVLMRLEVILRGRRGVLPAKLLEDLSTIERNVNALVSLINDFLELARLESPDFRLNRKPVDLCAVVEETSADFKPLLEAKRLRWTIELCDQASPVHADRQRLAQALSNLLGNAIKFTPAGGAITCRVRQEERAIRCEVEDTGAGIAPDVLPIIFQRYGRQEDHRARGSGLGLMIVREVIQAHGGEVGVRSEPGRGSTFWFVLPQTEEPQTEVDEVPRARAA